MSCLACVRELHEECTGTILPDRDCCCAISTAAQTVVDAVRVGRPRKDDNEIGVSAGRKRAADLYPNIEGRICEWRWKANCGGGKHPILGCLGGFQEHRHHGPVKNTSHNEAKNLHLICTGCHNRWHESNDRDYDEDANSSLPHNPTPMTSDEMMRAK